MFGKGNPFFDVMKSMLGEKNYTVSQRISDDLYEVTNGNVTLRLDVRAAREQFQLDGKTDLLQECVAQAILDFSSRYRLVSFQSAQTCLRLLLMRADRVTPDMIADDFIPNVKRVAAFTADGMEVYPLSSSYLKKWAVPRDVIFAVGQRNMDQILLQCDRYVSAVGGKIRVMEFTMKNPGLRAALMLAGCFRDVVSEKLGARFLVVAPSAESMMAVQDVTNNIVESFGPVVLDEYASAACPLTTDVLLFSPQGISIAGRFQVQQAPLRPAPAMV